jgi:hypothetical protein
MAIGQSQGVSARVFISCGQTRGSEEEQIAGAIAGRLKKLGFDTYIAVAEQSLRGLIENIFAQLRTSEYFIFIDFKREKLDVAPACYRGSLFAHQELAIASFLGLEVLAFQERGVKPDDGIMRFIQANSISFQDRHTLPSVIADKVTERNWKSDWRNVLALEIAEPSDAYFNDPKRPARYFHINVHNRHLTRVATNCYAYLEKVVRTDSGAETKIKTIEFKWEGTGLPSVAIAAGSARAFDAVYIFHDAPTDLQFNALADSSGFFPNIRGEGEYELTYMVLSENFPIARATFKLDLRHSFQDTTFTQRSSKGGGKGAGMPSRSA